MDECTVELVRHGSFFRVKDAPDQIKLVGRYAHEASIHIIGAISRHYGCNIIDFIEFF